MNSSSPTVDLSDREAALPYPAFNPSLHTTANLMFSHSYNSLLSQFLLQRLHLRGNFKNKQCYISVHIRGTFNRALSWLLSFLSWPLSSGECKMISCMHVSLLMLATESSLHTKCICVNEFPDSHWHTQE